MIARKRLVLATHSLLLAGAIFSAAEGQVTPCFDSDGDGWADPEVASDSCPPDNCPAYFNPNQSHCANVGDPNGDGMINIVDVVRAVSVAFRDEAPDIDSSCVFLQGGTDVNCDSVTNIVDVVRMIDVAFRNVTEEFCRPCECECYPDYCDAIDTSGNLLPNRGSFEKYCRGSLEGWRILDGDAYLTDSAAPGGGEWCAVLDSRSSGGFPGIQAGEPNPVTGSIYRLTVHGNTLDPYQMGGPAGVRVALSYGGQSNWLYMLLIDTSWVYAEVIDTIGPEVNDDTLRVQIISQSSFNRFLIDRVTLENLGQAAP